MRKSIFAIALFIAASAFTTEAVAQEFKDLDKSPMDMAAFPASYKITDKAIKVTYSRPQLKGRDMATLAPAGKVWRTGANEAAEITLYKSMMFGGKLVKPGTYSLFTIPNDRSWEVILSSDTNVWGAYTYNEKNDVARSKGAVSMGKESLEAFSMAFDKMDGGVTLYMGWGNTRVSVPFTEAVMTKK